MSKQPSNNPFAPLAIGFFIGAITVGTAVLVWHHNSPSHSPPPVPTYGASPISTAAASDLDSAVTRVAARFVCSCGACGEERLEVCSCPTAQQERAFILDHLREGHSETEAADALNQKYGGLKS